MSEPARISADLPRGFYEIRSLAAKGNPLTGIGPNLPDPYPVHVDAAIHVWEIKPEQSQFPGAFRLSLQGPLPYTGVENDEVIVASEESKDILWYIWRWKEEGVYTIASAPFWPTPSWTLASEEPNAKIVIRLWEIEPDKTQLFKIRRLLD